MLRLSLGIGALLICVGTASAQYGTRSYGGYGTGSNPSGTYVQPRVNSNGTYTPGHYRSSPNNTTLDNYGTRGNVNPYTGQVGTRSPGYR